MMTTGNGEDALSWLMRERAEEAREKDEGPKVCDAHGVVECGLCEVRERAREIVRKESRGGREPSTRQQQESEVE